MSCRCKVTKAGVDMQKRQEFRDKYKQEHILCPKCFSRNNTQTHLVFKIDLENLIDYKDLNNSVCTDCGDTHTVHERLSI